MGEWARMVEVTLSAPVIVSESAFRVFVRYTPNAGRELGITVLQSDAFLSDGGTCRVHPAHGYGAVQGINYSNASNATLTYGDSSKPIVGSIEFDCRGEVLVDQKVTIQLMSLVRANSSQQGEARHVFNQLQLVSRRRSR